MSDGGEGEGLPHPRETYRLIGHAEEETELAESQTRGRAHHAWLLTGPQGLGKATLAYRFARRLLGARPVDAKALESDPADPVCRMIAGQAHPDLHVLERGLGERGKPRRDIPVDDVRGLGGFFALKPGLGGYRVAIVDSADELNRSAANALLKTLEEPPPRSALLLIAHAPGRLLPTIRSRCRVLRLRPVPDADIAAALGAQATPQLLRLASGRPGRALELAEPKTAHLLEAVLAALAAGPRDRGAALQAMAFASAGDTLPAFLDVAEEWCRKLALEAPDAPAGLRWATAFARLQELRGESEGLPLDPTHAYVRAATILSETMGAS